MLLLRTGEVIQEPIPTVFVRNKMLIFFAIGSVIPLIFACLKPAPFMLISVGLANAFIAIIRFAWPIAFTQYEAMKQMGLLIDAVNYAAFLSILFLFACALLILSIVKYVKVRHELKRPDGRDLLVIIIGVIFYFVTLLDQIVAEPSKLRLFPDENGMYYFRQYIIFSIITSITMVALISVIRVFDRARDIS